MKSRWWQILFLRVRNQTWRRAGLEFRSQQLFFKPCFINKTGCDKQNLASSKLTGIFLSFLLRLKIRSGVSLGMANRLASKKNTVRCFSIWFLLPQRWKSWKLRFALGLIEKSADRHSLPSVSAKFVRAKLVPTHMAFMTSSSLRWCLFEKKSRGRKKSHQFCHVAWFQTIFVPKSSRILEKVYVGTVSQSLA